VLLLSFIDRLVAEAARSLSMSTFVFDVAVLASILRSVLHAQRDISGARVRRSVRIGGPISVPIGYQFGWLASRSKRKWLGCAGFSVRSRVQRRNHADGSNLDATVRQVGIQRNGQEQVEALVRLLLEPVGRRQRQKLLEVLDTRSTPVK
jgi:hypothetical protein